MPARATRRVWPTAGVGGYVEAAWHPGRENPAVRIEVGLWSIAFRYRNVELPESGGRGAMGVFRVAESFRFTAELVMPFGHEQQGGPQPGGSPPSGGPFVEEFFRGFGDTGNQSIPEFYNTEVKFQIGDPARLPAGSAGTFYFCPGVMIETATPSNPSRPPFDVARSIITGRGSVPLERWVEGQRISGNVFDFDE